MELKLCSLVKPELTCSMCTMMFCAIQPLLEFEQLESLEEKVTANGTKLTTMIGAAHHCCIHPVIKCRIAAMSSSLGASAACVQTADRTLSSWKVMLIPQSIAVDHEMVPVHLSGTTVTVIMICYQLPSFAVPCSQADRRSLSLWRSILSNCARDKGYAKDLAGAICPGCSATEATGQLQALEVQQGHP